MTSGASTAGSTLPTEAKVCCKNIAARASNIRDKPGGSEGRSLVPIIGPIVVRGNERGDVVAAGLFCGGYVCCRSMPSQISHAVSLGMLFVHRSCRDAPEDDLVLWAQAQPCTRGGSLYQGDDGSSGFARRGVEIAQGVERLDQPVALIRFPTAGIDPQPRHRRAVEAPAQVPLKARGLESGRNLRNLRGGKI